MKHLGVVLKTVERCNINCTYCYFFNGKDTSYKKNPPYIEMKVLEEIVAFLKKGAEEMSLESLTIGFHGGEPLLQKKEDFSSMCELLVRELGNILDLDFTLQTNAMLIDDEWIELLSKYKIKLSVSIDGPKEYHDAYRVDKRSRGTYDRVVKKVTYANKHPKIRENGGIGVLSVINANFDGRQIYRHFVDELSLTKFDFLFPDYTHESTDIGDPKNYGQFICHVFDEWVKDDNPNIRVRFLNSALRLFFGKSGLIYGIGPSQGKELPLITIRSSGEISPSDELMSTSPEDVTRLGAYVSKTTLSQFLKHPIFKELETAQTTVPDSCSDCCWQKVCGGGGIVNRFSKVARFNNPSIYCAGLQDFYSHVCAYLIKSGHTVESIMKQLSIEPRKLGAAIH